MLSADEARRKADKAQPELDLEEIVRQIESIAQQGEYICLINRPVSAYTIGRLHNLGFVVQITEYDTSPGRSITITW